MARTAEHTTKALQQLTQLQEYLASKGNHTVSKYEVIGRLAVAIQVLSEHTLTKHENDAQQKTRQTTAEATASAAKEKMSWADQARAQSERQKKKQPPLNANGAVLRPGPAGPTKEEEADILVNEDDGGWATITRKANKAKPGNATLQEQRTKAPKAKKLPVQQLPKPREEPPIRAVITKEADWIRRASLQPNELAQEIAQAAGAEIANLIASVRVYRGGDVKIRPKTTAQGTLARSDIWLKKWIDSTQFAAKTYPVVVQDLWTKGTAD